MPGKGFRATYVIHDEKTAMLLVDPMRRTILNLPADDSLTESRLSGYPGLAIAPVGHHLRILLRARVMKNGRRKEDVRRMIQNVYRSVALCVLDTVVMSKSAVKYCVPIIIERIRGALAATKSNDIISTERLDMIAEGMAVRFAIEASEVRERKSRSDREATAYAIY